MPIRNPEIRHQRLWGDAKLIGDDNDEFFQQDPDTQARALGYSNACPVVDRLVKPPLAGRGPEAMKKAYGKANFWFTYLARELQKVAPQLYAEFMVSRARLDTEPPGVHDEDSVSEKWENEIAAPAYVYGYTFPRLLLLFIESTEEGQSERMIQALDVFNELAATAENLDDLLVKFTASLAELDMEYEETVYIRRLLSAGKRNEDNIYDAYLRIFSALIDQGGKLWETYESMTPEDLRTRGIADVVFVDDGESVPEPVVVLIQRFAERVGYDFSEMIELYEALEGDATAQLVADLVYEYGNLNCEPDDTFFMRIAVGIEQFQAMYGGI